ncbi:MAG: linear amide C-N hydrolase [Lachnospiraceae bacterium]
MTEMTETTESAADSSAKKKCPVKKILIIIITVLLALVLVLGVVIACLFGGEILTVTSRKQVDDKMFYTMTYKGDYGFDDFLAGGGAESDGEVVSFVVERLLRGIPLEFELPDLGCSTIFTQNSENDGYLFGRNFDMYASPAVLLYTKPENGYRSFSMVNLAYIGYSPEHLPDGLFDSINTLAGPYAPLDGMNEKGLCVGVLLIPTECTNQDNSLPDITTTTAIRMLLDKAATVEEALALLKQYDMHSSAGSCYHFQIADATGRAVVVEYIENEMSIVENPYATNFLLTVGDWYNFGKGQDRFELLASSYKAKDGVMSSSEVMAVLASVSQTKEKTGKDTETQWSCVYDTKNLTVTVCYHMDYEHTYTFSLLDGQ